MSNPYAALRSERLVHFRDLLWVLVTRDMKIRYKRSALGLLWTLVNPLAQLLVFQFVFGVMFKVGMPNYAVFLFVGIVAWNWFSGALMQATTVFVEHRDLIRRPGFPIAVLPAVTISSHLVHFVLTLPVLFALVWFNDIQLGPSLAVLPFLLIMQFLITLGIAYPIASLHVAFRDTQYLLGLALMLGFYITPIFYAPSVIPPSVARIFELNPMLHVIGAYRSIFMFGTVPAAESLLAMAISSVVCLVVGYAIFAKMRPEFVREL